jgi:hypothetical protein
MPARQPTVRSVENTLRLVATHGHRLMLKQATLEVDMPKYDVARRTSTTGLLRAWVAMGERVPTATCLLSTSS